MDSVFLLARIFGPFFLIMGLWMYFRTDDVQKLWNSVKNTPPLLTFGGVLNLLIGLSMLSTYHGWTFGIPLLLTLIGYLMVLRGILVLFMPTRLVEYTEKLLSYGVKTLSIAPLVIGVLLIGYVIFA